LNDLNVNSVDLSLEWTICHWNLVLFAQTGKSSELAVFYSSLGAIVSKCLDCELYYIYPIGKHALFELESIRPQNPFPSF
jgi:hypothetical protein